METPDLSTVADALAWARTARGEAGRASLEAQVLLAHHLHGARAWVLAHPETPLDAPTAKAFARDVARLAAGEPLPYLTGLQEFYGLGFNVTRQVLIPRPETELLVDEARAWLEGQAGAGRLRALDIGTGSGCIAIALAMNAPALQLTATDISNAALDVARANAQRHEVDERIRFVQADLLLPFAPGLDLVCANPPYIPSSVLTSLETARHEPHVALDGGLDGLDPTRRLLSQARQRIKRGGRLLVEVEESHGPAACELARESIPGAEVALLRDLAGRDRLLRIDIF